MQVTIHPTAVIYPNVIFEGSARVEAGSVIGVPGAIRGEVNFQGRVIIKNGAIIGANVVIAIGAHGDTIIGENCLIMNKALIGHNVQIGNDCEIGADSNLCGYSQIGDRTRIKTAVTIRNRAVISHDVTIGMGAVVTKNITEPGMYYGHPARIKC
jgi:UDP-3-O-[3-hydroxymyristoyl] glucosamine N-acyltransferase